MTTSTLTKSGAEPRALRVTDDALSVDLADGRTISVPLQWFPRLVHGNVQERNQFEFTRTGIHWPELDEDISIDGLLRGEGSAESPKSIQQWLKSRAR